MNLKADTQGFEDAIVFNSVTVDSNSTAAGATATISEDGKTIEFTTHTLKSIGEVVTIEYDIKNDSQYDAEIGELTCTSENSDWSTYISLTEKNTLNGTTLTKQTTSTKDNIEIEMIKSYAGTADSDEISYTFTCNMTVNGKESS